ncbi:hypothetical protein OKW40_000674 [Paraburkholderia sp. RAU6.4a]|uniref:hypothetical protein n=1 Tax=Paraburkholderia sp. RAU6.4a TaxID=2991067 RepID=UPI003D1A87FC
MHRITHQVRRHSEKMRITGIFYPVLLKVSSVKTLIPDLTSACNEQRAAGKPWPRGEALSPVIGTLSNSRTFQGAAGDARNRGLAGYDLVV